jgi:hypothetical protein
MAFEWPLECLPSFPGHNPTTSIYNASVVNFYNTTGSLARFENKSILFYFEKRSSLHTATLALYL